MRRRDDSDRLRMVLAETTAVADEVVRLLKEAVEPADINRELIADVIWLMQVRIPGRPDAHVIIEQFDHVRIGRGPEGEGPGGTTGERARWIVTQIIGPR